MVWCIGWGIGIGFELQQFNINHDSTLRLVHSATILSKVRTYVWPAEVLVGVSEGGGGTIIH